MSVTENRNASKPLANRWRLWVDGCGGYLILAGDRWTVGGAAAAHRNDIAVGADWPRNAGTILRSDDDYFWEKHAPSPTGEKPTVIQYNNALPIPGSARLIFRRPSPLSSSVVLSLDPPHRFADHIDAVVLADQTILIGPTTECHIRGTMLAGNVVMTRRGEAWFGKSVEGHELKEIPIGKRVELGNVAFLLEAIPSSLFALRKCDLGPIFTE